MVERFPRFFMMPPKRRERLEAVFQKPAGQSLVMFLRLFPLTRILVNIPAGLAKMPFGRFLMLSSIGILLYHATFMWFAYEVNRPGSTLATQREHLEEAYASPAWAIIEANQILVAIGLLLVGMVVGVRAAFRMHRDPHQSTGSIIGWATTMVLIWGGIGLAGAAYMAPGTVYVIAAQGGVDIPAVAALLDQYPAIFLLQVAAVSIIFGSLLAAMRGVARRSKRAAKAVKKEEVRTEKAAKKKEKRAAKKEAKPPVKMSVVQEAPAVDEPNPDANDPEDVDGSDENLDHATDAESSER